MLTKQVYGTFKKHDVSGKDILEQIEGWNEKLSNPEFDPFVKPASKRNPFIE